MRSPVLEPDPRAGDELLHRTRDQHFPRPGQRSDSRPDVDGDPADVLAAALTLARVNPAANLEPPLAGTLGELDRAAHAACRSIERCEEPVTGLLDLAAA